MSRGTFLYNPGKRAVGVAAALCVVSLAVVFTGCSQHSASAGSLKDSTATIERRSFSSTLRLSGTTQAARSFIVTAPRLEGSQVGSLVITRLAVPGSKVSKGDFLVEFDPQAQTKDYLEKKTVYDGLLSQVATKQAELDIAKAKDDTALQAAEDELKRSQLEIQKNEIVSRIDVEKNQEALDEADATLEQLKQTYTLKRAAASAAIRILEIQRDRAQEAMRYAQSNAAKMTINSPMSGVVVFNSIWLEGRMATVQRGDQVRPGVPFMQVVDPSQMEVRVELNQVDLLQVHTGQYALMHLDAYPGFTLPAQLEELSPLGHIGQFSESVKVFTTMFSIQGTDPRVLPDLSAALDLDMGSQKNALVVPCDALSYQDGHPYVWLQSSSGFAKHEIAIGARNDVDAVVAGGLDEGDIVRRSALALTTGVSRP